jgi:hypothetical protein
MKGSAGEVYDCVNSVLGVGHCLERESRISSVVTANPTRQDDSAQNRALCLREIDYRTGGLLRWLHIHRDYAGDMFLQSQLKRNQPHKILETPLIKPNLAILSPLVFLLDLRLFLWAAS